MYNCIKYLLRLYYLKKTDAFEWKNMKRNVNWALGLQVTPENSFDINPG